MYFAASVDGHSHLWRQRFPDGGPELITSGPIEAEGIAVEQDGRSIITSMGVHESAIWIHDAQGDRPLHSEGYLEGMHVTPLSSVRFASNGRSLFYLMRRDSPHSASELWRTDLDSGKSEPVLRGVSIREYDLSSETREVVYSTQPAGKSPQIWLAPLDRSVPPRLITAHGGAWPLFGPEGQVLFQWSDGKANYLVRIGKDGSGQSKVVPYSVGNLQGISSDRRWIALLMICWGIVSGCMFSIHSAASFYSLRFLLGAAEAGFFPGVIFYLRSWFPASARAGVVALFMTAGPVSGVIGGPISGLLLDWNHRGGLAGWQWMFLLEAVPAILLGFAAWFFLADNPGRALWLSPAEKSWLLQTLDAEASLASATSIEHPGLWFVNPRLWGFALVYFGLNTCTYGISLWLPTALNSLIGLSNFLLGLLSTVPYLAAATLMVLIGAHSDRTGERRLHIAFSAFAGGIALVVSSFSPGVAISVFCFAIALSASSSMAGPFWAMASGSFTAAAAAGSIALINAIGNLGSGFGPYWIGHLRQTTGSFRAGLLSVAALLTLAGLIVLFLDRGPRRSN